MGHRNFEITIQELQSLLTTQAPILAVHYACESFFTIKDRPVGVSCVAFAEVGSGEVSVFSVIDRAEEGEKYVLESFFRYMKEHPDARLLHWNMNSADFGFRALENRYAYLFNQEPPHRHSEDRIFDLDDLVGARYGKDFADHPRLKSIANLNDYQLRSFLSGRDEAERYAKGEHGEVRRSVSEKASLIVYLARRLLDGTLETKNSGRRLLFAGTTIDSVQTVATLGHRFLDVSRQLLRRHGARPTLEINDEYDAQDLFHSLLRVFFDDVRKEEWVPSYAGAASRIDFVIPRYGIAIELKNMRSSMSTKDLGEQLLVDIQKYIKHTDVRHLICLIFDRDGLCENPRGIERDLSRQHERIVVTVRVYDR